ncbi:MAG: hypothetical protein ACLQJR_35565 [Stellaceae bacterium]
MKKRTTKRVMSSLGLIGAGVVMGAIHADAQTTGKITLSGTNTQSCTLAISPAGSYNSLNLGSTATNTSIGTSVESCNDLNGYTVTVASTNGGPDLTGHASGNTATLAYGVIYGSNTLTFSGGSATADSFTTYVPATNYNNTISIGVAYAGTPNLPADTYTDTLTFTLTAK